LTFEVKIAALGVVTCFDWGGHPHAIQLLQKCKRVFCYISFYHFIEISVACVEL